jgi:hypothetical protein
MLEFHVITDFSKREQRGVSQYVRRKEGLKSGVKILAYYACNNGIRSGQSMGDAWERMKTDAQERFGDNFQVYGAIMSQWSQVPQYA